MAVLILKAVTSIVNVGDGEVIVAAMMLSFFLLLIMVSWVE